MNWFRQTTPLLTTVFVVLAIKAPLPLNVPLRLANGFSQQLELLARKCDQLGLEEQAEIARQWVVPARGDQQIYYPFLNVDHHRPLGNAPQLQKFWYERFTEIRKSEAERLYQQALMLEDASDAYRLIASCTA